MIIRLSLEQKKILINEVLKNQKLINEINNNIILLNEKLKITISDRLSNEIRDLCIDKLLKIDDKLSEEYNNLKNLINTLNENITSYYKFEAKKNELEVVVNKCLDLLGNNVIIIKSRKEIDRLSNLLTSTFPFTKWGRIDWEKVKNKILIEDLDDILFLINKVTKNPNTSIYIIWGEDTLPIVKTELNNAWRVLSEITTIAFNTWLFGDDCSFVIEFHHEGEVTLGIAGN